MDGERFRPAIKQLEEKEALVGGDLISIVDDEDVIRPHAHHPGQPVLGQERTQVVVSDPAVLPAAFGEVVEEHVEDFVTYVIVGTVEEKLQKAVEGGQRHAVAAGYFTQRDAKGHAGRDLRVPATPPRLAPVYTHATRPGLTLGAACLRTQ